ncbi:MAG: ThuA domain-containing protein [Bryobacteraceae bacterium]
MIRFAALLFLLAAQPSPLKILIVDGMNNHDWQYSTTAVRQILTATGRFTVDVSTWDGAKPWSPDFQRYNAVFINFNGGHKEDGVRWPRQVEESLERYVRAGGGIIVFHAANNAFLHWDAYNEMIGLGWRDKSFGPGLKVTDDGRVEVIPKGTGMNPGHGPRHDFEMRMVALDHPIIKGMPRLWMHPSEQLTHGQHGPAQGLTILTSAYSKDSQQNEPMDWVRNYGKGRVYTTMLGHSWKNEPNPNYECPHFRTLLSRGVEWAASGQVTLPAYWPASASIGEIRAAR